MRSLYLRIWLTVVAALALFALVSGWLLQQHLHEQRERAREVVQERMTAWAELLQRSLPGPEAPAAAQAEALNEWSQRLRVPLALDDAGGRRVGASDSFRRREADAAGGGFARRLLALKLDDGRTLTMMIRPAGLRPTEPGGGALRVDAEGRPRPEPGGGPHGMRPVGAVWLPVLPGLPDGVGLALLLLVLFAAVAAGAWPVVRGLTRRLEALKRGVEAFGSGALDERVAVDGRDEVAALARSFNQAAGRVQALLQSHRSLLANASHELRSPLARLKMAVAMLDETPAGEAREGLQREIHADIRELDALVEEVLLASRLDAAGALDRREAVDLLPLAAEEAARIGAAATGDQVRIDGDERLLRRALRNLLENARRYGGDAVEVQVARGGAGGIELRVSDRGPGVPAAERERIFEPFYRLPGHAEREGGVGLGLSLVRQIAQQHGGQVRCEPREGGGSCFVIVLPG